MVQWLRLCASNAGGMGSIPGGESIIPHDAKGDQKNETKTPWCSQINIKTTTRNFVKMEMATHSSIFAWEIPGTEETGRLHYMRS